MRLHPCPRENTLLLPYCMHYLHSMCKQVLAFVLNVMLPPASYGSSTSNLLAITREAMAPDRANTYNGLLRYSGSRLA